MTARTLVAVGLCAVLVPLVSALPSALPGNAGVLVEAGPAPTPTQAAATEIPVRSTRLERRDASGGLSTTVIAIQRADNGPLWIGWTVPAVASREGHGDRWGDGDAGRCVLDDEGEIRNPHGINGGTRRLVILVRSLGIDVTRVAFTDERCTVDAGSRPVYWLSGVVPAQSVALMAQLVRDGAAARTGGRKNRPREQALPALALHGDGAADTALTEFVKPGQQRDLRRDAAFWMGAARGEAGAAVVERLARDDADDDFREHLTFVLTLIGDRGIDPLIALAKRDSSPKVRGQALFWLGQKAGQRAVAALEGAVVDDPDREVRKKAVFALSQLPKDQGVPKLIGLARTHRDPEVRKQAMFWLGQSGDERAVQFFEDVLKN
jgi:HEAT repeat protein